jgi:hypothetical protein
MGQLDSTAVNLIQKREHEIEAVEKSTVRCACVCWRESESEKRESERVRVCPPHATGTTAVSLCVRATGPLYPISLSTAIGSAHLFFLTRLCNDFQTWA